MMDLVSELKRRNVIRMAGLYLVGAWLLVRFDRAAPCLQPISERIEGATMILRRAAELLKQQHILRAPKSVADGVALSRNLALVFSFSPALGASAPQQEIMFNGQMDLIAMAQLGEQRAVGAQP